jgi:putative methionine-R-sulfoxide reductase with GAF domain
MIDLFKDRYKLSLLLAGLFLVGIIASIYQIYRLPHNLMLNDGYQPAMLNVYLIPGLTFLLGAFTLWLSLNYKNEVIVYRDKQLEKDASGKDNTASDQDTITLDKVRESLQQAADEKAAIQSGLQAICKQLEAGQGALYLLSEADGKRRLELKSGYALHMAESAVVSFEVGEGLVGQAAATNKTLYVDEVPEGYVKIISGLGGASPRFLLIATLKKQDRVTGVIEIASFTPLTNHQQKFVEESAQLIADRISGK